MPRFHHANLSVPAGLEEREGSFLVDVLLYRKVDPPAERRQARWFEADDGSQIHLSIDPDHRPSAFAHIAIEVDDAIESRLEDAGIAYRRGGRSGVVLCEDPAGNLWELRRSIEPAP